LEMNSLREANSERLARNFESDFLEYLIQ